MENSQKAIWSWSLLVEKTPVQVHSCTTPGVYLEPYQTYMTKLLVDVFLQKCTIIDIWQGSKYGSAASLFNIFSISLLGYLNEYMNIFFSLKVCTYFAHATWIKNVRYFIGSQNICFILTMEIPNFHIFIWYRCKKAHFEKLQDGMQGWYILLIKIITKK